MDASFQNGLTAFAGGGQAGGVLISRSNTRFTTVGTAADSALLPPASPGLSYLVKNAAAANSMNVFPSSAAQGGISGGDNINALAANAAFALAANKAALFVCMVAGTWDVILTA